MSSARRRSRAITEMSCSCTPDSRSSLTAETAASSFSKAAAATIPPASSWRYEVVAIEGMLAMPRSRPAAGPRAPARWGTGRRPGGPPSRKEGIGQPSGSQGDRGMTFARMTDMQEMQESEIASQFVAGLDYPISKDAIVAAAREASLDGTLQD